MSILTCVVVAPFLTSTILPLSLFRALSFMVFHLSPAPARSRSSSKSFVRRRTGRIGRIAQLPAAPRSRPLARNRPPPQVPAEAGQYAGPDTAFLLLPPPC